ncbi:MAG: hypothetical protein FWC58_01880, partial [Desulfobulbus sp.]|nr:hypothetical protein [Desulfobulbus sp.]
SNVTRAKTTAYVENLKAIGTGRVADSLSVHAANISTLSATAVGASLAGTLSGGSVAVAASVVDNKSLGTVDAHISNSKLNTLSDASNSYAQLRAVMVSAEDLTTLKGKSVGAALGFDGNVEVAVGASTMQNVAGNKVSASITGSTIGVSDKLTVDATEKADLHSNAIAASLALGFMGASLAGAGAESVNLAADAVSASISGSTITAETGVEVKATNDASIDNTTGAAAGTLSAAGLAASLGVSLAENSFGTYGGTTNGASARIDNSTITVNKGDVSVQALSSETIGSMVFAGTLAVAAGGIAAAGSGAQVTNSFASETTAVISNSQVEAGINGEAGSLIVEAGDKSSILKSGAYGVAAAAAVVGADVAVAVTQVDNSANNSVRAAIETADKRNAGGYDAVRVLAHENTAFNNIDAVTASIAASLGLAASGGGAAVTSTTGNQVTAEVKGAGKVLSFGGVQVDANTQVQSSIDLSQISIAVGIVGGAVGVGTASNTAKDKTTARVSGAQIAAPEIDVIANTQVDFSNTKTAGVAVAAALYGAAVNVNSATVNIATDTLAEVSGGAELDGLSVTNLDGTVTPGLVNVQALGTYYGQAYAEAITLGVVGVGAMSASTTLGGTLQATVDQATLKADIVNVAASSQTDRNGEAGLTVNVRGLEIALGDVSVDKATLETKLAAGVSITNGAFIQGTLVSVEASQGLATDVSLDAGTIAGVSGHGGKVTVTVGGSSIVTIGGGSGGAQVIGRVVQIGAGNTVRGNSSLSGFTVALGSVDVDSQKVTINPQALVNITGNRAGASTIDSPGMTVVKAIGDYNAPGVLDVGAFNDIRYTSKNKILGISGFDLTLSTNHIDATGALTQVAAKGAFIKNTFGDVLLSAYTEAVTSTASDVMVVAVVAASQSDSKNDLSVTNNILVDNSQIEGDSVSLLAGNGPGVTDDGLLMATDNVGFTLDGVGTLPLVKSGAIARQNNNVLIDDAGGASLIRAQRNVHLETSACTLDQAHVDGSVQVIGINDDSTANPTAKLSDPVVDTTAGTVRTNTGTTIIAGVNSASNMFVVPEELLESLGLDAQTLAARNTLDTATVQKILDELLGANSTNSDGSGGKVNIDTQYQLVAFKADDVLINVTNGMVVNVNGNYYRYTAGASRNLDLATEDYSNSYWSSSNITQAEKNGAISSTFAADTMATLGTVYYVLKTVDTPTPGLLYASQANIITEQINQLINLKSEHAADVAAVARYNAGIAALQQQLADSQLAYVDNGTMYTVDSFNTFYLNVPDVYASGGSVFINAYHVEDAQRGHIEARGKAQINIVNDSPLSLNVHDAVILDGTVIRPSAGGGLKVFNVGHVYVNDLALDGAAAGVAGDITISQFKNGWANDPYGGSLAGEDPAMVALITSRPVDMSLLGAVANPLGRVKVMNSLGSISVTGSISAQSLDIAAKGNFSLISDGWFNTGSNPIDLMNNWKSILTDLKDNARWAGQSGSLVSWNYKTLGNFTNDYLKNVSNPGIFALGSINISALTLNIDGKIQSGITDAYIRITSAFAPGNKNAPLQDANGKAVTGVYYSADGSLKSYGAITGYFDYATQSIIIDPVRLAGGSITLTGQIISVGNGDLIVANGYPSVYIDNQTSYALVVNAIDVSTYRKGSITIVDTARMQKDQYVTQLDASGAATVVHTQWNQFTQIAATGNQPDYAWFYNGNQAGNVVETQNLTNGVTTSFSYTPAPGQMMVWVMGWDSGTTTTTHYTYEHFNLLGDKVDLWGLLSDQDVKKSDPLTSYDQERPVQKSVVVAYISEGDIPAALRQQLTDKGVDLKTVVVPETVAGSVYRYLVPASKDDPGAFQYTILGVSYWYKYVETSGTSIDTTQFTVAYANYSSGHIKEIVNENETGGGWMRYKTKTWDVVEKETNTELFTYYVPASQPITIDFLPSTTLANAITIYSTSSISVVGNLTVGNGQSVYLESRSSSIGMTRNAGIMARLTDGQLVDDAVASTGGKLNVTAVAKNGAVTINVLGTHGSTSVTARNDIRINSFSAGGLSSWLYLDNVNSTLGNVYITAMSGIYNYTQHSTVAAVSANVIELNAGYGAIGTASQALNIDARKGFAAQAGLLSGQSGSALNALDKNIYVNQVKANADLSLVKPTSWAGPLAAVYSEAGSVSITLNGGSLLDGELGDMATASEKAIPVVTAQILSGIDSQLSDYDSYWQGVRALQAVTVDVQGDTWLSTVNEDGQYLVLSKEQYDALAAAGNIDKQLVRLAYNDSTNGGQPTEVLGYLRAVDTLGDGSHRFVFYTYDPDTGRTDTVAADLASIGYTLGS